MEEARRVVELNEVKTRLVESNMTKPVCTGEQLSENELTLHTVSQALRGCLVVFSGDNKTEYKSWKAAFMSIMDEAQMMVKDKMLQLLSSFLGGP